jgi:hypothetical protein
MDVPTVTEGCSTTRAISKQIKGGGNPNFPFGGYTPIGAAVIIWLPVFFLLIAPRYTAK